MDEGISPKRSLTDKFNFTKRELKFAQLCAIQFLNFHLFKMNKRQRQLFTLEAIVILLVGWEYYTGTLTFNHILIYTMVYILCMAAWFYFRDQ